MIDLQRMLTLLMEQSMQSGVTGTGIGSSSFDISGQFNPSGSSFTGKTGIYQWSSRIFFKILTNVRHKVYFEEN